MGQQLLFFINQGKYYKEDELRYKHFEVDISRYEMEHIHFNHLLQTASSDIHRHSFTSR